MSTATVDDILENIKRLTPEDRERLHRVLLDGILEDQWQREAEAARREARTRGIDDAAIDAAVHRVRYGQ
jgi:hypothetical protein